MLAQPSPARASLVFVPVGMIVGFLLVLVPTVVLFRGQGWYQGWMALPAYAVSFVYPLSGMAVGGWLALLQSARGSARAVALDLRSAADGASGPPSSLPFRSITPDELERRHGLVTEQLLGRVRDRERKPALSLRLFARHLGSALLEDFLPRMHQRERRVIDAVDLRDWLRERGIAVAIASLEAELRRWGWIMLAGALLLAALPLVLVGRLRW